MGSPHGVVSGDEEREERGVGRLRVGVWRWLGGPAAWSQGWLDLGLALSACDLFLLQGLPCPVETAQGVPLCPMGRHMGLCGLSELWQA